jgi:glycerophosphoryl diester phosphodiesterase
MFIWGHRGCRGIDGIDENTMPAFAWAVEHGCHGLEFDVQVSVDGVPFVFHDRTLERLTDGRDLREVQCLTWHDISEVSLTNGGRVPALSELIVFGQSVVMNLEVKSFEAAGPVTEFIYKHGLSDWIVSSFINEALIHVRTALPDQSIGYLLECVANETVLACGDRARIQIDRLKPERIHLDDSLVSTSVGAWLRQSDYPIHVWTVNREDRGRGLEAEGIVGLFSDDVRLFVK